MTKSAPELGTLLQDRAARVDMLRRADPEGYRNAILPRSHPTGMKLREIMEQIEIDPGLMRDGGQVHREERRRSMAVSALV